MTGLGIECSFSECGCKFHTLATQLIGEHACIMYAWGLGRALATCTVQCAPASAGHCDHALWLRWVMVDLLHCLGRAVQKTALSAHVMARHDEQRHDMMSVLASQPANHQRPWLLGNEGIPFSKYFDGCRRRCASRSAVPHCVRSTVRLLLTSQVCVK